MRLMSGVEDYIKKQKPAQKEMLTRLRKIIKKQYPKMVEEMKLGVPWYEGKFYLVGLKDSVNMGFCVSGMDKKSAAELRGKGEYMRHLKFKSVDEIDAKKIKRLMKATVKNYVESDRKK